MTVFENWAELLTDVEDLFNNERYSLMYKEYANIYPIMLDLVKELQDNTEKYINEPKLFNELIFDNEKYSLTLLKWLPYLSGARAELLEMKFLDKDKNIIIDKSSISEAIKSENKEITSSIFISIEPREDTLKKFFTPVKKLKI